MKRAGNWTLRPERVVRGGVAGTLQLMLLLCCPSASMNAGLTRSADTVTRLFCLYGRSLCVGRCRVSPEHGEWCLGAGTRAWSLSSLCARKRLGLSVGLPGLTAAGSCGGEAAG
jgi:hypothetical protein